MTGYNILLLVFFLCVCFCDFPQSYLKSVNDLWGEFQEKKVGVYAVCGQQKKDVDEMMSKNKLKFKVSNRERERERGSPEWGSRKY